MKSKRSNKLVVAQMQMTSIDDVEKNLQQIVELIAQLKNENVRLLSLPENALYMRIKEGEAIKPLHLTDHVFVELSKIAIENHFYIHVGASPIEIEGHVYNSSVLINDLGEVKASYQKIHLFDIQLEGQAPVRESDAFKHGQKPSIFEIDGWKIGETICYDLRFAELFSVYAHQEVDLILVPAAFLVATGKAHWEILLRARAIESQAYILATAQCGVHQGLCGGERSTFGHSLCVEPWGKIENMMANEIGVSIFQLDVVRIEQVRAQIPMKYHRRLHKA